MDSQFQSNSGIQRKNTPRQKRRKSNLYNLRNQAQQRFSLVFHILVVCFVPALTVQFHFCEEKINT